MFTRKSILLPLLVLLPGLPAWAATPADGELSDTVKELSWAGDGPYVFTNLTPQLGAAGQPPVCDEVQPVGCDIFTVNVNISDDFRALPENQRENVAVGITFPADPGGQVDYDLYIYDEAGNEVGRSAGSAPQSSETVSFALKKLKNGKYFAKVIIFTPLGTDYEGYASIGKKTSAQALSVAPQIGSAPLTASFDTSGMHSTGDCSLDFGDGSEPVATGAAAIEHTYLSEGEYLASVKCSGANGAKAASAAQSVSVLPVALADKSAQQFGGSFGFGSVLALLGAAFARRRRSAP